MRPKPLPPALTAGPFSVGTAITAGVSHNRLNAHDLNPSVWGVRDLDSGASLRAQCARFASRLNPNVAFSHSTAALIYGVPLQLSLEMESDLHVSVAAPVRAPHANGLRGHSLSLESSEVIRHGSLRVTSAERTWCDLASQTGLLNLIAAGDSFISQRHPLTTMARMNACMERHPHLKKIAAARQALALLDGRAESRPESMLRVLMQLGSLPRPRINHSLVATTIGRVLRPDFEFTEYKTLLEYQGDYHRTPEQWRKDMTRRSRLEAAGWTVIEINADDLRDVNELLERIAVTLRRHGWHGDTRRVFAQIQW